MNILTKLGAYFLPMAVPEVWRNHWSLNTTYLQQPVNLFKWHANIIFIIHFLNASKHLSAVCWYRDFAHLQWLNCIGRDLNVPKFIQKILNVFNIAPVSVWQWFYEIVLKDFYLGQTSYALVYGFSAKYRICVVWDCQQVLDIRLACYLAIHWAITYQKLNWLHQWYSNTLGHTVASNIYR